MMNNNETQQIIASISQMIDATQDELSQLLAYCRFKKCKRQEILSSTGAIPDQIFFINKGIVRVIITDNEGNEHTIHFALENQFIADYAAFILKQTSLYTLRCEENTEVIILPRAAIEWGYQHMAQGDRLGRLVAEYYFIYQDNRIKNLYARTPKERYDSIEEIFPDIHNRVPQHMIASYLGITPVHLSRLKKASRG